jgi:hypothetical protein
MIGWYTNVQQGPFFEEGVIAVLSMGDTIRVIIEVKETANELESIA